jgi:pimeloyl-ACP methyl ester carboxylesterase
MSVIILNQAIVHYEALGRGRPVVFLHSWVGSWRYWISAMQVVSTSYRAYALDLFGYGDTTHDPDSYAVGRQADLLAGFLDELGIGKVALVGHGLGALVGLLFASEHPERVARMMAVCAPLDSASVDNRFLSSSPGELVDWLSARTAESQEALADASKADPRTSAGFATGPQAASLVSYLAEAGVPCLLVYGNEDPSLVAPALDRTLALGPNVHQLTLDDSGHFPMLEAPDRFHRILTDFLALESGLSPRELQLKEEWRRRVR